MRDRNDQIAQQFPSFGGMWFDSTSAVHVYTTRLADSVDLRIALIRELRDRGLFATEVTDDTKFVFHQGLFNYTELSDWRHIIARASVDRVPGYQSSAVRNSSNQIRFGVTDARGIPMLRHIADSLDIPARAVMIEVEGVACTLEARAGILISPRDSLTGQLLVAGTRAFARDGNFADSIQIPDSWTGRVQFLPLTHERAGVYDVGVDRPGYRPWRAEGIRVDKDACHVKPVSLTAYLLRNP